MAEGDSVRKPARRRRAREAAPTTLAPRWGRLHLRWGEALAAQGKAEEARATWRAAAGMDLAPANRTRLLQHLVGRS